MRDYTDPGRNYSLQYPENWIALADEGSPHLNLASNTTGGLLHIEAHRFDQCPDRMLEPEAALRSLAQADQHRPAARRELCVATEKVQDGCVACADYDRPEKQGQFGHVRLWARNRGCVQVRCMYRCRRAQAGADDAALGQIVSSLEIHAGAALDAGGFSRYYFSRLKRHRPMIVGAAPEGLMLSLRDGQVVLLDQVYNHYRQEPERLDQLIETHLDLLDYCGDDVPDLGCYQAVRPLLFPKLGRLGTGSVPPHRLRFWPGLGIGAVVQGRVFHYGVNTERLHQWGVETLQQIWKELLQNLAQVPVARPVALRNADGQLEALTYTDHPFSSSYLLFEDFYQTTAENLGGSRFLVAIPEPGQLCCCRADNPRYAAELTSQLRWDYHRSPEGLTDTIYLVVGPRPQDARPFDLTRYTPHTG